MNGYSFQVGGADDKKAKHEELMAEVRGNFQDFLDNRKEGQPFFYSFNPTNPHRKWLKGSGKTIWGLEPDDLKGKMPPFLPDVHIVREDFADYLGEAMAFDAACGEILKMIEAILLNGACPPKWIGSDEKDKRLSDSPMRELAAISLSLANDKVPNVRLNVGRVLESAIHGFEEDALSFIKEVLNQQLATEKERPGGGDRDVLFFATRCIRKIAVILEEVPFTHPAVPFTHPADEVIPL